MITLEQRLEALLAAQTEHPVYPRITLRGFDATTLDAAISLGGRPPFVLPVEEVQKLRDQREKKIAREKADRFRYRCEPEMWKKIDLAMAKKRLAHPGVQLELLVMGDDFPDYEEWYFDDELVGSLFGPVRLGERLGSATGARDIIFGQDDAARWLHPICSPTVAGGYQTRNRQRNDIRTAPTTSRR